MGKVWKPVEDKFNYTSLSGDRIDVGFPRPDSCIVVIGPKDDSQIEAIALPSHLRLCRLVPDDEANADVAKWQGFEDTIAELRSQLRETQTRQALDEGVSVPVKVVEAIMALAAQQEASGYSLAATRIRRWLRQQQKGGE